MSQLKYIAFALALSTSAAFACSGCAAQDGSDDSDVATSQSEATPIQEKCFGGDDDFGAHRWFGCDDLGCAAFFPPAITIGPWFACGNSGLFGCRGFAGFGCGGCGGFGGCF
jgi:hypothetical protein